MELGRHRTTKQPPRQSAVDPAGSGLRGRISLYHSFQWLALLGCASLIYLGFSRFGVQVVEVVGESMSPTLHESDRYLLKRWVYYLRKPQRSEVVVLMDPMDRGFSVKRIIATEGETVLLRDGSVYVNGRQLKEPYLGREVTTRGFTLNHEQMFRCGEGEYFVLGDNRSTSVDSRSYGPVPRQNILGLILP